MTLLEEFLLNQKKKKITHQNKRGTINEKRKTIKKILENKREPLNLQVQYLNNVMTLYFVNNLLNLKIRSDYIKPGKVFQKEMKTTFVFSNAIELLSPFVNLCHAAPDF